MFLLSFAIHLPVLQVYPASYYRQDQIRKIKGPLRCPVGLHAAKKKPARPISLLKYQQRLELLAPWSAGRFLTAPFPKTSSYQIVLKFKPLDSVFYVRWYCRSSCRNSVAWTLTLVSVLANDLGRDLPLTDVGCDPYAVEPADFVQHTSRSTQTSWNLCICSISPLCSYR